jgi:hypothetical protein
MVFEAMRLANQGLAQEMDGQRPLLPLNEQGDVGTKHVNVAASTLQRELQQVGGSPRVMMYGQDVRRQRRHLHQAGCRAVLLGTLRELVECQAGRLVEGVRGAAAVSALQCLQTVHPEHPLFVARNSDGDAYIRGHHPSQRVLHKNFYYI